MSFLSLQEIRGYAALLFVNVNHCFITEEYSKPSLVNILL